MRALRTLLLLIVTDEFTGAVIRRIAGSVEVGFAEGGYEPLVHEASSS